MSDDCQQELAGRAWGYLMAAGILHQTMARSRAVDVPELHLIGTGFEMMLKDALMQEGKTVEEVASCGDRLLMMWELDAARAFRDNRRKRCEDIWPEEWTYEFSYEEDDNPWDCFQDEVIVLDGLHRHKEARTFRYNLADAPAFVTPAFLLATSQPIANDRNASFIDNRIA